MEGEQVVLQASKTIAEDELLKDLVTEVMGAVSRASMKSFVGCLWAPELR